MALKNPVRIVAISKFGERSSQVLFIVVVPKPQQLFLACAKEWFAYPIAFLTAHKAWRGLQSHECQLGLKVVIDILTSHDYRDQHPVGYLGLVNSKHTFDRLANWLQGFLARAVLGRMKAEALPSKVLKESQDRHLPLLKGPVAVASVPQIRLGASGIIVPSCTPGPWGGPPRTGAES